MNGTSNGNNCHCRIGASGVLGHPFYVWRKLQHGQERIIRFGRYMKPFGDRMRHQNGHEHRCSVCFLFDYMMIGMRPYCRLDELLLSRCVSHHDEPEGIRIIDLPADIKTDEDDLKEYLVFRRLCGPLGVAVWRELERSFLLQFCLRNPACFPEEARLVMTDLAEHRRNEALFFDGVQRLDYMYYAYECYVEHDIIRILVEVARNQIVELDAIAAELPGFDKVVWTLNLRDYFKGFVDLNHVAEKAH